MRREIGVFPNRGRRFAGFPAAGGSDSPATDFGAIARYFPNIAWRG
jgi:hypothetical protein